MDVETLREAATILYNGGHEAVAIRLGLVLEHLVKDSDFCPRCGVDMQTTHAPWCTARDGTPAELVLPIDDLLF